MGCCHLKEIMIEGNIERVGEQAFLGCTKLKRISFPYGLREVGARAFAGCFRLEQIDLPASVDSIGPWAFLKCPDLHIICSDDMFDAARCYADRSGIPVIYRSHTAGS